MIYTEVAFFLPDTVFFYMWKQHFALAYPFAGVFAVLDELGVEGGGEGTIVRGAWFFERMGGKSCGYIGDSCVWG